MANTRELSQLASLINVIDNNKSIGVVTEYPNANVGIGTLSPIAKVDVVGDAFVSGIVSATSFYGDGSNLTGLSIDANATVSISTTPPQSPNAGDMWYSISHARTFIYYQDEDSSQWIDSAPFNTGITTSSSSSGASVSIGASSPSNPNSGDLWYSTTRGRLFIYYTDTDSSQWIDSAPFRVGVVTTADSANTATVAEGLTGFPSIDVENINATGIITASSFVGDASGLTGIAYTDNIVTSTPAEFNNTVTINDQLEVDNINVTGIVTAFDFDTLSDINFKTNIETVDDALYKVKNLRGVKFNWIQSGRPAYGVIAQELEKILPELVHGGYGIDPKTVNFNGIIGVLIEAVKELSEKVEKLEKNENF